MELGTLRTGREDGEVMGAIFDYLRWLGVEDVANQWNHWLREEFLTDSNPNPSNANGEIIRYPEKVFPGQHSAGILRCFGVGICGFFSRTNFDSTH